MQRYSYREIGAGCGDSLVFKDVKSSLSLLRAKIKIGKS